jgi:DNA topoisomerase-6 subunit B
VRIIRFANRVPLLYQTGACVSTSSVEDMDWRRYELEQRGGKGIPIGPVVLRGLVASVNVPFTSEAKEAIADIDQIRNEVVLALRECARKMGSHVRKKAKLARMKEKEETIRKLIPKIAEKSAAIVGKPVPNFESVIARIMNNMMITDTITPTPAGKKLKVEVKITNYCSFGKTFHLYSAVPHGVEILDVSPTPEKVEDGLIVWKVKRIPTTESELFSYALKGLDPTDYDETDLYVKGIDEELVIGAEAWKGKDEVTRMEKETVRTITAEGAEVDGFVERDEDIPTNPDQEEDIDAEKTMSKKKGVELAKKDARVKPAPKKKGTPFPMPKAAQKQLSAIEPAASVAKRQEAAGKATKKAGATTGKGGKK